MKEKLLSRTRTGNNEDDDVQNLHSTLTHKYAQGESVKKYLWKLLTFTNMSYIK